MVTTAKVKNASPNTGICCRSGRNGSWLRPGSTWELLAALFVFVLVPGTSAADTLTFQEGDGKGTPSETDDAYLREASPTSNFSTGTFINIDGSPLRHAVLKFPNIFGSGPNQIPLGSSITSATLTLEVTNTAGDHPSVWQITESWVESQVSWDNRSTGPTVTWSDPGVDGTTSHKATKEGDFPTSSTGFQSLSVTTSVQNWSDGEANEGWVFTNNSPANGIDLSSSEHGTPANRPKLSVTYTSPLTIVKTAFELDGTPIATGATIPYFVEFKYMLYINNPGIARSDVTVRDVLDAAFQYQTATIQVDNSVAECALTVCTAAEELAIFTAVNGAAFLSDAMDGDVASYTGASLSVDAGDGNVANLQLDINADAVWAILFSVKMP